MHRWLGIGGVLAVLVAVLGYVSGSKQGGPAPGAKGWGARTEGNSTTRSRPVSALLSAPLLSPRGSLFIRGTVVGLDGRPLAGAKVVATAPTRDETLSELSCPCDDEREAKLPLCTCGKGIHQLVERVAERQGEAPPHARTTSDAEGRFSLEGLEAGTYALWADGSFGTVLRKDVPAGSEGIELWVGPGMTLSGRIHDEDGNPAAGALVTALLAEPSRFFDTLADDRGNWRLGPLPVGRYHLVVTQTGFLPEHDHVRESRASEELEVTLYRPLRLTGQVLREGRPVAGARVQAEGEKHQRETSTDAQGRFTLEDLRPSTYQVSAAHAGLDAVRRVSLGPGMEPRDVLLELGTDARVTGTVRDPAGHPIAGATIVVRLSSGSFTDSMIDTRTGSDGTYTLGPLPLGRYRLSAVASRYYSSAYTVNVSAEGPNSQDFTLEPTFIVEGRVLSAAGQPVPGVELELEEEDTGKEHGPWRNSTSSGEDGTFVLEALKPGSHHLRARHEEFLPTAQTVVAPSSGVQVLLRAGARVEGEVVDEKELPVPQAQVLLRPAEASDLYGFGGSKGSRTDERGRFTLQGLKPGKHLVSVSSEAGGEVRRLSRSIEVNGMEPVRVRLQFPMGLTLSGLVIDGAGNPVPEATLSFVPDALEDPEQERNYYGEPRREPRTGADGRFQVRHLAAGRYLLRASAKGYDFDPVANGLRNSEGGFQGVKAVAGSTDVRIVLEKLARLRGRVVRPDGTPVTRFEINQTQVVDPQGAFALPIDWSREEKLVFTAPNLTATTRVVSLKEGVDTELGEVVLTPGRVVRGRVVDAATGAPVAGAGVQVDDDPKALARHLRGRIGDVRTARDGTFTLTHVEERPLTLGVGHPDYKQTLLALAPRQAEVTVALETGATLQGEVYLSSGRLFDVFVWSPDFVSKARVVGNEYELRGLPAGTYVVIVQTRRPTHGRNVDVPPRQVEIPASGVVVLDFEEPPAKVTLRLRWVGPPVPEARYYLVAGRLPLPDSPRAVERLDELDFAMRDPDAGIFYGLSEGHYTLLVRALVEGVPQWHREELELPGEGEVSRDLSTRWVRVPGLK